MFAWPSVGTAETPERSEEQTQPPREGSGQPSAVTAASGGVTAPSAPPSPVRNSALPSLALCCRGHISSFYVPNACLQSSAPCQQRPIRLPRTVFFEGKGDTEVNEGGSVSTRAWACTQIFLDCIPELLLINPRVYRTPNAKGHVLE